MGGRCIKLDDNKKILKIYANILYGSPMSQMLQYVEIETWPGHPEFRMNKLEEILNTPDDSDIGYFVEVNLEYPDNIKEKKMLLKIKYVTKMILLIT